MSNDCGVTTYATAVCPECGERFSRGHVARIVRDGAEFRGWPSLPTLSDRISPSKRGERVAPDV
jgi:hypothetical protein